MSQTRVVGYVRVSTQEQAVSGLGLADQEKLIRDTVRARPDLKLVEIIRDEGQSGGTLERPGLRRALSLLAAGRADGIMVAKLDRLSRSIVDFGLLLEWLRDAEKVLAALDLGIDTSTAAGAFVAHVLIAVAEWERRIISERTKAALGVRRSEGRPIGRTAVVDDQALTDRIKAMRERMTLQQICDELNAERVPTMRGGTTWRPSSVQSALGYKRPPKRRKANNLPDPRGREAATA